MTDVQELKNMIVRTWHDAKTASYACDVVEGYAKLWPCVYVVNDWDVWTEGKRALRLEVALWIERNGAAGDFYQPLPGLGLVGFKDLDVAARFELRWSSEYNDTPDAARAWNPHPLNSSFQTYRLN